MPHAKDAKDAKAERGTNDERGARSAEGGAKSTLTQRTPSVAVRKGTFPFSLRGITIADHDHKRQR